MERSERNGHEGDVSFSDTRNYFWKNCKMDKWNKNREKGENEGMNEECTTKCPLFQSKEVWECVFEIKHDLVSLCGWSWKPQAIYTGECFTLQHANTNEILYCMYLQVGRKECSGLWAIVHLHREWLKPKPTVCALCLSQYLSWLRAKLCLAWRNRVKQWKFSCISST